MNAKQLGLSVVLIGFGIILAIVWVIGWLGAWGRAF